ncbi:OmpA family protein [Jannaschia pohangensis]|uniref:OmpA-OmpF porin, OOP family n=1 Tax=Jannaschia pohangensis TaxID=390807 RepID=A0A1I3ME33_9RHOB|nr:OmpA family protein [Jannaschia pohangensis]SFI95228.1 OmpA-OmpF porin, OOP family [Jannaschia pohangensis]
MSRRSTIATIAAFGVAAAGATAGAWFGAEFVEDRSRTAVSAMLASNDMGWAGVETDGLQLILTGTAPDEPARFRAITRAGYVVDPSRVIDAMEVAPSRAVTPPRFSLEILRNEDGVSVIGLVPTNGGQEALQTLLDEAGGTTPLQITNMVETADYPVSPDWEETLRFGLSVLKDLPRAKISVMPGSVTVTAVADSDTERLRLEQSLTRRKPEIVDLVLNISAPRPVITPFTLRYVIPPEGRPRFEACAVDSLPAEARILRAAQSTGFTGRAGCVIGLGVPSASWGEAASLGIEALGRLGGGALTLSDADVSLVAREGTDADLFDTVVAELGTALPDLFVLSAVLPEPTQVDGTGEAATGTPEFVATLSPEGQVQLRGRLYDDAQQAAVVSYGRALFGFDKTYVATRQDESLPQGWPARVLSGLDALSRLEQGVVIVQPDLVVIRGVTGNARAEAEISGLLSDKLGAEANFRIEVRYEPELDPLLNIPTPEECEDDLNDILTEQKLTFAPGAAVIEASGDGQIGRLKDKLDDCERAVFEVGGHTDSQGSEGGNLTLSVQRADAVRAALIARGVRPSQLVAKGYGESQPIADNGTEEGRETNRRITFTLLGRRDADPEDEIDVAPDQPVDDTTAQAEDEGEVPAQAEGETAEGAGE